MKMRLYRLQKNDKEAKKLRSKKLAEGAPLLRPFVCPKSFLLRVDKQVP